MTTATSIWRKHQFLRYIANGVVATVVHYVTLRLLLDGVGLRSAGLSNLAASCIGIGCSFVGSRTYVFEGDREPWLTQFGRFAALYGILALVHGAFLHVWTDRLGLNPSVGFLIAIVVQTLVSYFGNKTLVFSRRPETDPAASQLAGPEV